MNASIARIKRIWQYVFSARTDYITYALWVRLNGLDFSSVLAKDLGLSEKLSGHHSASGGVFLSDILKKIEIPPKSRIVDLGCGKGSAICTIAEFPFEEVVGVELSEELVRIAQNNCRKLGIEKASFCVADAGDFRELDRFTHIYMYNPFSQVVMTKVMQNLAVSLKRSPRKLTVIYFYPVYHEAIIQSGLFQTAVEIQAKFTHSCRIYVHEHEFVGDPPQWRATSDPGR